VIRTPLLQHQEMPTVRNVGIFFFPPALQSISVTRPLNPGHSERAIRRLGVPLNDWTEVPDHPAFPLRVLTVLNLETGWIMRHDRQRSQLFWRLQGTPAGAFLGALVSQPVMLLIFGSSDRTPWERWLMGGALVGAVAGFLCPGIARVLATTLFRTFEGISSFWWR